MTRRLARLVLPRDEVCRRHQVGKLRVGFLQQLAIGDGPPLLVAMPDVLVGLDKPRQRLVGREQHRGVGRPQPEHDLGHRQSTLILAACTTAVHFCSSAAMKAPNCCGVPGMEIAPIRVTVSCISGALSPSLIAALSLPTMPAGVPAGAMKPLKVVTS